MTKEAETALSEVSWNSRLLSHLMDGSMSFLVQNRHPQYGTEAPDGEGLEAMDLRF